MENLFKNNYSSGSTDELLVSQAVQGSHTAYEKLITRHPEMDLQYCAANGG